MDFNFNSGEFDIDEPLFDETQQQQYSGFMLDQPLDLFEELSGYQESLGSSGHATNDDSPQESMSGSTFPSSFSSQQEGQYKNQQQQQQQQQQHMYLQFPVHRRESSDESDMGIVDDIIIPTTTVPTVSVIPSAKRPRNHGNNASFFHSDNSTSKNIILDGPNFLSNAFVDRNTCNKDVANSPAVIKLEPTSVASSPKTPAGEDVKSSIVQKPCLVISSNGSLTALPIAVQARNEAVNSIPTTIDTGSVTTAKIAPSSDKQHLPQQVKQEELDRAAKRQLRIIKNREAATLSRMRQKQYLESLEQRVRQLAQENEQVKQENEEMRRLVGRLHEENTELRGGNAVASFSCRTSSVGSSAGSEAALSPRIDELAATPTPLSVLPIQQTLTVKVQPPDVIDLVDEPVAKKILIKPATVQPPVVPQASSKFDTTVKPVAKIVRDTNSKNGMYGSNRDVAANLRRQSGGDKSKTTVFTLTRRSSGIFLVFSLIFVFNCFPLASKLFRESSTSISPISMPGASKLSLNSKLTFEAPKSESPSPSRTIDGGQVLYPANRKPLHNNDDSNNGNDLMIFPSSIPPHPRYFEGDIVDDNDLPLMDDALMKEPIEGQDSKCLKNINVNATHSQRIVNALAQWASIQQRSGSREKSPPQSPYVSSAEFPTKIVRRRSLPDIADSFDVQLYRRRSAAAAAQNRHHQMEKTSESLAQYEKFAKTIRQRNDTFYMVSFHVDQLIYPALVNNGTTRPKMSLILPALFSLNETVGPPEGSIALMQIECEITDMKILHLGKHLVPLDIVYRHMRQNGAQADGTSRMYRQWMYGKDNDAGAN